MEMAGDIQVQANDDDDDDENGEPDAEIDWSQGKWFLGKLFCFRLLKLCFFLHT